MMDDGVYANQTLEFSPRKSGQGRNANTGVPASSSPSPGVPASPSRCIQILLVVLSFSLVCSLSALAAVSFLYSRCNQSDFLPEETSHLVSTPSANVRERTLSTRPNLTKLPVFKDCEPCPKHWVFHGGKCYFFSTDSLNWTQSRDRCVSMGGHLVIINSQEEQTFLSSRDFRLWIGLNDLKTEGQWLWMDNTSLNETGVK
ncbi:hypothetical protein DPEC_G00288230 [Dallia pectoralis]|uniref:Uncharacterized protein n=1 Tax=Dallia pectoralis TaxID=75939 RepID=A0ACC2FKE2_DALPE|nr:hypothetical protein DPEC_G00288230 [Dallia pectoralis]